MGTLMFQFLALEFMRNQMLNIGVKPYTEYIVSKRADRLAKLFPEYDSAVVRSFAKTNAGFGVEHGGMAKEELK